MDWLIKAPQALADAFGPVMGSVVALVGVLILGVVLRQKGVLAVGDKTRVVKTHDIEDLAKKVTLTGKTVADIQKRLREVERDIEDRPTWAAHHELEKRLIELDGRLNGMDQTMRGMSATLGRFEEYMIQASLAAAQRGGK